MLSAAWVVMGSAADAADPSAKSAAAVPPVWQKVVARKGGCLMYVPPDWTVNPALKGTAGMSDNSASAVISLADSASTLAQVKPVMQGNYPPTRTFEDTAHRLWYQYGTGARASFYVGVPVKGGICGAQITFKPGQEAIANRIAASVGPGS